MATFAFSDYLFVMATGLLAVALDRFVTAMSLYMKVSDTTRAWWEFGVLLGAAVIIGLFFVISKQ